MVQNFTNTFRLYRLEKKYKSSYFSTTEIKLRSLQIRLNLRFLVMNVQMTRFSIIGSE